MSTAAYRYQFTDDIGFIEVEELLSLAVIAAEALHGAENVRLDAEHTVDPTARTCEITADTGVGRDLNKLFAGFLSRGFEPAVFRVERVGARAEGPSAR